MSRKLEKNFVKKMLKFFCCWNLDKHSITFRNYTVNYCKNLEEVPRFLTLEKPKNRQQFSKNLKITQVKLLKFVNLKKWKLFRWQIENFSVTYYQTRKDVFWTLRLGKPENVNNEKQMPIKLKKNARFVKKMLKFVLLKLKPFHHHQKLCSNLL